MHDVIGDIHGHADELIELLQRLGYSETQGGFWHPTRKVVFCGDFIDRGPRILDTVRIVRQMCENGTAQAVMGNHEYNALTFHTPHPEKPESFLRRHSEKNIHQHRATLDQLAGTAMDEALKWFRTLPVSLDLGKLRVVHACWDERDLQTIDRAAAEFGMMSPAFLLKASDAKSELFAAVERVLKGPEMQLPHGRFMVDKEGNQRPRTRIRWFEHIDGHNCASYSIPELPDADLAEIPVPATARPAVYDLRNPPLFIGHYWLPGTNPAPLRPNVACVDYSVAKHGMLTAYRHHGESVLQPANFVTVPSRMYTTTAQSVR